MEEIINIQEQKIKEFISECDKNVEKMENGMPETMRSMFIELTFLGALFLNPILIKRYSPSINPLFDFSSDTTRFFYNSLLETGRKTDWIINISTINSYMADNLERAKLYQGYGGSKWIEYIMQMAQVSNAVDNITVYYNELKKYTITRAYWLKGFREIAEHIVTLKSFKTMNAKDITEYVVRFVNSVYMNVTKDEICVDVTQNCTSYIQSKLETPQMGIPFAFPLMTQLFQGIRLGQFMCFGMLSNAGKTRFLIREATNLAFVHNQKICIISNEMSTEEIKSCLITSAINNTDIQKIHKIEINKNESELQNGLYKVDEEYQEQDGVRKDGFAKRLTNDNGEFIESIEDYKTRLYETSTEYRNVIKVMEWIDKEMSEKIFVIETGIDYTDNDLQQLIDNMIFSKDIKYFFYDTFKSDIKEIGEWSAMKKTATILSNIAKKREIFIGATIQLTDDANKINPLELSSSNIANSKQIKHVLDSLCLFKEITQDKFDNYRYVENLKSGTKNQFFLNNNSRYYACVIDKNRAGEKRNLLFELDLNKNIWEEVGIPLERKK